MALTAAQTAFISASDFYTHEIATYTDSLRPSRLWSLRADVARAHIQSLINAAALAFPTGALNASMAAGLPGANR